MVEATRRERVGTAPRLLAAEPRPERADRSDENLPGKDSLQEPYFAMASSSDNRSLTETM